MLFIKSIINIINIKNGNIFVFLYIYLSKILDLSKIKSILYNWVASMYVLIILLIALIQIFMDFVDIVTS